jgi:hypothetical protein
MELEQNTTFTAHQTPQQSIVMQAAEKHYTVSELSRLWVFSESTIRRLFAREPGVIKICHQATRLRRGYTSMRIPERIARRVHRRLQGLL